MANCPYCGKYFAKKQPAVDHINKCHGARLEADGMDACQSLYFSTHGTLKGKCQCGCGKDTEWNYHTGKPYKVSPDPKCRERLRNAATTNMVRVYGKTTLLDDMQHQKEMQEHRHIAGKYQFKDGGYVEYLGSLEKNFLMFCDKIMDLPSNAFIDPPENFTYFDNKEQKTRTYMPDYYMPDYNLLIEIKDGGAHPNTNPAFIEETKYKVALKDDVMKKQTRYNYIRISGKNYSIFVEVLYKISHDEEFESNDGKKRKNLVVITESACFDPTESIDVNKVNPEDFRIMYLLCGHSPQFTKFIAIAPDDSFSNIYLSDYMSNELYRTSLEDVLNDPDNGGLTVDVYKYAAGEKVIQNVFFNVVTMCNSGETSRWDILSDYLQPEGAWFTDKRSSNNTNKKMCFIYIGSKTINGGEEE